jgi:predicted metal-dependent peptidase
MNSHYLYEKLTQYYRDKGIVSLSHEVFDLIPPAAYEELHEDLLQAIRLQSIGKKILETIRTEIFLSFKFFGLALSHFQEASGDTLFFQITPTFATNGKAIYFNAQWLIRRFKQNPRLLIRDYLHVLFHTIFKHHRLTNSLVEAERWNLAADITAEYLIDQLNDQGLNNHETYDRKTIYDTFLKHSPLLNVHSVYEALKKKSFFKIANEAKSKFYVDDHRVWYPIGEATKQSKTATNMTSNPHDKKIKGIYLSKEVIEKLQEQFLKEIHDETSDQEVNDTLDEISARLDVDLHSFHKAQGTEAGNLLQSLRIRNRKRYDYRDFLRRFMTPREIMKESLEEFDYIYYTLGLTLYQNMPLLEPLEYSVGKALETFVIAIDTSGSTFTSVVEVFLEETFQILKQADLGTRRIQIYLIQCDAAIAEERIFRSYQEFVDFKEKFQLKGGGGTDFRPVFTRVEQLIKENKIHDLKGLVYFTDGMGTYPEKRTSYETAFVFYEGDQYNDVSVPSWASKLIIQKGEIE